MLQYVFCNNHSKYFYQVYCIAAKILLHPYLLPCQQVTIINSYMHFEGHGVIDEN